MSAADELAKFRASYGMDFYVAAPSVDGVHWVTYEIHSPKQLVFDGFKEEARAVADALNSYEMKQYEQAMNDFLTARWLQEAEHACATQMARLAATASLLPE